MKNSEISKDEARIQQECVVWYRNTRCLLHHPLRCLILSVPNEGNPYLTQIGAMPGASDLIVAHRHKGAPKPRVRFTEVKTPKGRQSTKQKKFAAHVRAMGFDYDIIHSLEEFKKLVEKWDQM